MEPNKEIIPQAVRLNDSFELRIEVKSIRAGTPYATSTHTVEVVPYKLALVSPQRVQSHQEKILEHATAAVRRNEGLTLDEVEDLASRMRTAAADPDGQVWAEDTQLPTTMDIEMWPEFFAAMQEMNRELEESGLLPNPDEEQGEEDASCG